MVPDCFELERRFGLVGVLGEHRAPADGFTIGGQAAAGAANLHTAVKETKAVEEEPLIVRYQLAAKAVVVRWCDDVLQIYDRNIAPATARFLRRLRGKRFYGKKLELKNQGEAEDTAFGFVLRTAGGVVRARAAQPFDRREEQGGGTRRSRAVFQSGRQYAPEVRMRAAAIGRFLRVLDTTNESEEEVLGQLWRVLAELLLAGYAEKTLESALRRVQEGAWLNVVRLRVWLRYPKELLAELAGLYDGAFEVARASDAAARAREREARRR
jgi:hypothetical protein